MISLKRLEAMNSNDEATRWSRSQDEAELRTAIDYLMPTWWNGRRIHAWHSLRTWACYDEVGDVDWERLAVKLDSGTVTGDNEDRKGRT